MIDALTSLGMSPGLQKVAERAKREPAGRFHSLAHLIDEELLAGVYRRLRRDAAVGVDGITKEQYGQDLQSNLRGLHERLRTKRYRHQPIRRVHIPKEKGRTRPIGISTTEDKVVQGSLREVLQAIYEQDFLDCSYGFRPGRSAHDAVRSLTRAVDGGEANWILEFDVVSFFDSVDRKHLMEMLQKRVADGSLLRLVGKCLHVGVLDGEAFTEPSVGTVQGSTLSPLLGNAYLHYGAPGQTWCFQRVKFPPRQEVQPPHRESSLGSEEVTNRTKRRQSDARAVTKVKQISLVKYLSAGRQHRSGWQAPVGAPQMARWPETAAGSECTARSKTEASRDLGDPLWSRSAPGADRVCRTIWLTPEKGRRCSVKSDSLVVLRARESRVHGEAAKQMKTGSRDTSPAPTEAGV